MKKIIIAIAIIIAVVFLYLVYSGLFASIDIIEKEMGPYTLVFQKHTGPYSQAGKIQKAVYEKLKKDHNIQSSRGFGIYYDNPENVPAEKLRSDLGCIIDDSAKITAPLEAPLQTEVYEKKSSVTAEFPFRSMGSIFIGIYRVYPKMSEYIKEKGYKADSAMEIYDMENKKIIYSFPVIKK